MEFADRFENELSGEKKMKRHFIYMTFLLFIFCNCTDSFLEKGAVNLQLGDYLRACSNFEHVVNKHPTNVQARLGLGKALLQQWLSGSNDTILLTKAIVQLEAARTLHSGENVEQLLGTAWCQHAENSLKIGDTLAALKALSRATSLDPKATKPLNMAAIIYFHRNERKKALELFRLITTIDTSSASGYFNTGMVHWADSNYQFAAEAFFEAAKRIPDDQEILRWTALAKKYAPVRQN